MIGFELNRHGAIKSLADANDIPLTLSLSKGQANASSLPARLPFDKLRAREEFDRDTQLPIPFSSEIP